MMQLGAAPDPQDLPAGISSAVFQNHSSTGRAVAPAHPIAPHQISNSSHANGNIPISPWIPSSRGARAPLIAATIAFASDESCRGGTTGVIVLPGACTTARAEDVADLSACSRRSSVHCFFESVELPAHSTPGLRLQISSICHGSCAGSSPPPGVAVSGSRYRKGADTGSSCVGEQDTIRLAVPLPPPLS